MLLLIEYILVLLIVALLNGAIAYIVLMEGLSCLPLYAEQYMSTLAGANLFQSLFDIVFGFGVSLIVLKFQKKGFETHVLWSDGTLMRNPCPYSQTSSRPWRQLSAFPPCMDWFGHDYRGNEQ